MKKIVIKVSVGDERKRQKVLGAVSRLKGINEISIDVEKGTLTITGGVDPICVVNRLRKLCLGATIDSVADPPKPEDKKGNDDKKKDEKKPCCEHCILPPCPTIFRPFVPPCHPTPCYMEYEPNSSSSNTHTGPVDQAYDPNWSFATRSKLGHQVQRVGPRPTFRSMGYFYNQQDMPLFLWAIIDLLMTTSYITATAILHLAHARLRVT
ncbi:hypothetical protein SAY87_001535 [Trapa incisa]|uniref:HMA domain-containing protein n=1 Tax=Trapa incisa TaxID=236973 RepID=A0AAN7GT84_9MYRT|nr:hypothetical protein SAY87_001535 [Trapa incisa]